MSQTLPHPELFKGYDAGHYTLPEQLVKLRDTHLAIQAMPYPKPPHNSWETVNAVAVETVDAVHNGTKLPDVNRIEQARAAERIYQDALDMMGACLDLAGQRLREGIRDHGLAIITDHLQPAHADTWQGFKQAWRTLQEYGQTEPRHLLAAPAKVRKASDTCDQLADRYAALHAARTSLTIIGFDCPDDPRGKYAAVRNYHQLMPSRLAMARPPWHGLNVRQFLGWHTDNAGDLWMPTPEQQRQAQLDELPDESPLKRAAGF